MPNIYTSADQLVGHTPLQVVAGMVVGIVVGCLYPMHLL